MYEFMAFGACGGRMFLEDGRATGARESTRWVSGSSTEGIKGGHWCTLDRCEEVHEERRARGRTRAAMAPLDRTMSPCSGEGRAECRRGFHRSEVLLVQQVMAVGMMTAPCIESRMRQSSGRSSR